MLARVALYKETRVAKLMSKFVYSRSCDSLYHQRQLVLEEDIAPDAYLGVPRHRSRKKFAA